MKKKFPKEIYVHIESDERDETTWLSASTALAEHAEMGETRKVAVYELVSVHDVVCEPELVK